MPESNFDIFIQLSIFNCQGILGDRSSETVVHNGSMITTIYHYGVRGWLMSTVETNGAAETRVSYSYDRNGNQTSRVKGVTSPAGGSGSLSNESDYAAYYGMTNGTT